MIFENLISDFLECRSTFSKVTSHSLYFFYVAVYGKASTLVSVPYLLNDLTQLVSAPLRRCKSIPSVLYPQALLQLVVGDIGKQDNVVYGPYVRMYVCPIHMLVQWRTSLSLGPQNMS